MIKKKKDYNIVSFLTTQSFEEKNSLKFASFLEYNDKFICFYAKVFLTCFSNGKNLVI